MKGTVIAILLLSISLGAGAQEKISVEEYIARYKDIAIQEMKRMGIPAAITLAQGILETENGNSDLVKRSNNHFGIKCKDTWTGARVFHDDDESGECFRAYETAEDSYRDHSNYLRSSKRYEFLFRLDATDYKGWAYGIKKAGYATNPRYPQILIKNIEQYDLQQYTLAGLGEAPKISNDKEVPADTRENKTVDPVEDPVMADMEGKILYINKIKCVLAKKGTALLAVAIKNDISLVRLMEFNDLATEGILEKDQYVFLHRKSKTGGAEYYIVQPGETLYDVAQKNGVQLKYIREYNNLSGAEAVNAGDKLFLQPGFSTANGDRVQEKVKVHYVEPREGLYSIARKYKVTVKQLKQWNNLDSNELKIGQELIVSK